MTVNSTKPDRDRLMVSDEREKRLPAWVRETLGRLRAELSITRIERDEAVQDARIARQVAADAAGDTDSACAAVAAFLSDGFLMGLPNASEVRFRLDNPTITPQVLDVSIADGALLVDSIKGHSLAIEPQTKSTVRIVVQG